MALFCKLSVVLLFSLINFSMENVLKKDTETLPDVIAEGDPESNINIFESCFFHLILNLFYNDGENVPIFSVLNCFQIVSLTTIVTHRESVSIITALKVFDLS